MIDKPEYPKYEPNPTRPDPTRADVEELAEYAGPPIVDAAVFVVTAISSGVLGNAAYDAIKAMFRRERASEAFTVSEREQIARLAVRARCAEVGVPVPRGNARCQVNLAGELVELDYGDLRAKVRVPEGGLADLEITLYQVR